MNRRIETSIHNLKGYDLKRLLNLFKGIDKELYTLLEQENNKRKWL